MSFEIFFRSISYLAVFCGFFSLWVSGTFGVVGTGLFIAVMVAAWFLEDSEWRISERLGTVLIVLTLPLFYWLWKLRFLGFANTEAMLPGVLARLILTLSAIKLLQRKSDRDWIFLYLMAFFEVLLAAGLSISALYLASFLMYLLVMVCATIAFEIRKTATTASERLARASDRHSEENAKRIGTLPARRLPVMAAVLILLIAAVATPLFFALPRVGGAGLGGNAGGVSTSSGFSDTVRLGGVGRIQQNDEVVMRVRVENNEAGTGPFYWRGIALDTFDNQSWTKSRGLSRQPFTKDNRPLIQLDFASGKGNVVTQTFYLEPLDTSVLFGLPRALGVQGNFSILFKDADGSITFPRTGERTSYKVLSDRTLPPIERLRADNDVYPQESMPYLQLPDSYDSRIDQLALELTAGFDDRYQKSAAVERYLQNNFRYSLEQKPSGDEPLADFLFNVREGHCEYFSTAMAVMLRTQGIATRVVNGFQQGDYNDTADVYVVRQRHAHSWVEVYFPKEKAWIHFDPTPAEGHTSGVYGGNIYGRIGGYLEALETFWIQYFVAFDNQEQQSLVRSARTTFLDVQYRTSGWLNSFQNKLSEWWADARGDRGLRSSVTAFAYAVGYIAAMALGLVLFVWLVRKIVKLKVWQNIADRLRGRRRRSIVEFYERMERVLASKGLVRPPHQTPLEFAYSAGMPEAVNITKRYNRVRFGRTDLSESESSEIESLLGSLEATDLHK